MELILIMALVGAGIYFTIKRRREDARGMPKVRRGSAPVSLVTTYVSENEDPDDGDSWEGGFWDASDPKPVKAHLQVSYTDANGSRTRRSVRVREFDNLLYKGILIGHCELRDETRTFRFDRISQCIDLETGECIDDVRGFLNERYESSPDRSVELLVGRYLDALKVLYFVAKADGQYRRDEKLIITSFLQQLVRDDRITTDMIDAELNQIGVPSLQGFKMAFGRVAKSGDINPEVLMQCCQELVDTQSTVHPAEKEALDYMAKRWERFHAERQRVPG